MLGRCVLKGCCSDIPCSLMVRVRNLAQVYRRTDAAPSAGAGQFQVPEWRDPRSRLYGGAALRSVNNVVDNQTFEDVEEYGQRPAK